MGPTQLAINLKNNWMCPKIKIKRSASQWNLEVWKEIGVIDKEKFESGDRIDVETLYA